MSEEEITAEKKNSSKKKNSQVSKLSTREFLKVAGVGAVALTLGLKSGAMNPKEIKEFTEHRVLALDIFDIEKFREKATKDIFPADFSEEEAMERLGIDDSSLENELMKAESENPEDLKLLMLLLMESKFSNHGIDVVHVMRKTSRYLNPDRKYPQPQNQSIVEALKFERFEFDDLGNPTMHFEVDPKVIEKIIANSDESLVNMSFQVGKLAFRYQLYGKEEIKTEELEDFKTKVTIEGHTTYQDSKGNVISEEEYNRLAEKNIKRTILLPVEKRRIEEQDGYLGNHVRENVSNIVNIANKFPEKTFIVAGGNPTRKIETGRYGIPDIRKARNIISSWGKWPENLLFVGFYGTAYGGAGLGSRGSDIYVHYKDLERLGYSQASSYATPVLSETVRQLGPGRLVEPTKSIDVVKSMTESKKISDGSDKMKNINMLDLDKVKSSLTPKQKIKNSKEVSI